MLCNFLLFISFTSDLTSDSKQFRIRISKISESKGKDEVVSWYEGPSESIVFEFGTDLR